MFFSTDGTEATPTILCGVIPRTFLTLAFSGAPRGATLALFQQAA